MKHLLPILLLLLCACSRKTTETVYRHTTDTLIQTKTLIDRIVERDSVNTYTSGDTVFVTKTKWRWRDRQQGDTIYIARTDTAYIDKVRYVEKKVEKKLSWWQTFRLNAFWVLIALLLLLLVWHRWAHLLRRNPEK